MRIFNILFIVLLKKYICLHRAYFFLTFVSILSHTSTETFVIEGQRVAGETNCVHCVRRAYIGTVRKKIESIYLLTKRDEPWHRLTTEFIKRVTERETDRETVSRRANQHRPHRSP